MDFLILGLATYGLASALYSSDGPFGLFYKLRKLPQAKVLECFLCTAVIIGAVFALYLADNPLHWMILSFGLGGMANLLHALSELDL